MEQSSDLEDSDGFAQQRKVDVELCHGIMWHQLPAGKRASAIVMTYI
jgi:hypothetical protein